MIKNKIALLVISLAFLYGCSDDAALLDANEKIERLSAENEALKEEVSNLEESLNNRGNKLKSLF